MRDFSIALSLQIYVLILKEILGEVTVIFSIYINHEFALIDPGYSLCWDDVQILCVNRHHSLNQNKMMLWGLCFATRNIISFRHLDYEIDTCAATIFL